MAEKPKKAGGTEALVAKSAREPIRLPMGLTLHGLFGLRMDSDHGCPNSPSLHFPGPGIWGATPLRWKHLSGAGNTPGPPKISPALWNSRDVDSQFLRDWLVRSHYIGEEAGLCPIRSEPLWACLQVEFQFLGPSEVLICPSRREDWHTGKEGAPFISSSPISYPLALCQAFLWFPGLVPLTGSEV